MPNSARGRLAYQAESFRFYPDNLLTDAQDALAHLADIDLRYQKALGHAAALRKKADVPVFQDRLMQRHHRERRRFEEKLSLVHKRISALMLDDLRSNQG